VLSQGPHVDKEAKGARGANCEINRSRHVIQLGHEALKSAVGSLSVRVEFVVCLQSLELPPGALYTRANVELADVGTLMNPCPT
jgi:hypothetical protein